MTDQDDVSVRRATGRDADALRALVDAAYGHYVDRIGREPKPMTADYDAIAGSARAWVAERGGRIIGLVVLGPAEDHLLVENVAVEPGSQGRGVGGRLLGLAEEEARARGLTEVRLYTHELMTENRAYYPRRGYRETHRSEEPGDPRVFFTKSLLQTRDPT